MRAEGAYISQSVFRSLRIKEKSRCFRESALFCFSPRGRLQNPPIFSPCVIFPLSFCCFRSVSASFSLSPPTISRIHIPAKNCKCVYYLYSASISLCRVLRFFLFNRFGLQTWGMIHRICCDPRALARVEYAYISTGTRYLKRARCFSLNRAEINHYRASRINAHLWLRGEFFIAQSATKKFVRQRLGTLYN